MAVTLCSDFTAVVDNSMDRTSGCARAALEIKSLIHHEDLNYIWIYQHSTEHDYSYYSPSKGTLSGIDLILIYKKALLTAQYSSIGYIIWSDHTPITVTLSEHFNYTGKPLWRLNNFLLKSPSIVAEIEPKLVEFFSLNSG